MRYTKTARHLNALCDCLEKPLPDETLIWLSSWARYFVERAKASDPVTVEAAAKLGARSAWLRKERFAERDAMLREIYIERFSHLSYAEAARQIRAIWPNICCAFPEGSILPDDDRRLKDILKGK